MKHGLAVTRELSTIGELIDALGEYNREIPLESIYDIQSWQCADTGEVTVEIEDNQ